MPGNAIFTRESLRVFRVIVFIGLTRVANERRSIRRSNVYTVKWYSPRPRRFETCCGNRQTQTKPPALRGKLCCVIMRTNETSRTNVRVCAHAKSRKIIAMKLEGRVEAPGVHHSGNVIVRGHQPATYARVIFGDMRRKCEEGGFTCTNKHVIGKYICMWIQTDETLEQRHLAVYIF